MANQSNNLWSGVYEAVGFVAGALSGFGVARFLGFDPFAPGYGNGSIFGILLIGLGGGLGVNLARRWLNRNSDR